MRRLATTVVGSLLLVLSLCAGCSSSSDAAPAGCGAGLPTASGPAGSDPVISIPNSDPNGQLAVCSLRAGTGPVVRPSDYVLINVEGKAWAGNRSVVDSYTNRQPQGLPLSTALPAWKRLAGQRVGGRVLMVVPPKDGFGSAGNPAASITGTDTLVFVFDVLQALPAGVTASGAPQAYHPSPGDPKVTDGPHGPTITVPYGAKPPDKLTVTVLRKGSGEAIRNGSTVVTQYTGSVWRTGKLFDSSWQRGFPQTFVLGAGQVLPGWEQGLGGLPVGSRVLLIVPPSFGYGPTGHPPDVNGTDTLVFVIDIVTAVSGS
jgi:peptidylprolyl isomerase